MRYRVLYPVLTLLCVALVSVAMACGAEEEEPTPRPGTRPVQATPRGPVAAAPAAAPAAQAPTKEAEVAAKPKQYSAPPAMTIDPNRSYTATVQLEKGGEFVIELFAKDAPNTVNNFVFLAREGFYDGVTFHRVVADFMAQGGDPTGTGTGGAGYKFESELTPDRRHDGPGVLSMANSGGINTNGSQFFITFKDLHFLDGYELDGTAKECTKPRVSCHTVFGKVIEGLDVALNISLRDPQTATRKGDAMKTILIAEE